MPKYQNINHSCLCVLELQVSLFSYSFIYFTNLCWWVFSIAELKSFHFNLRFLLIWDFFIEVFFYKHYIQSSKNIQPPAACHGFTPRPHASTHPLDPRSCFLIVTCDTRGCELVHEVFTENSFFWNLAHFDIL